MANPKFSLSRIIDSWQQNFSLLEGCDLVPADLGEWLGQNRTLGSVSAIHGQSALSAAILRDNYGKVSSLFTAGG